MQILHGRSNGQANSAIGRELFISEDTVETHARRLFNKIGAVDRADAVAVGLRTGLPHQPTTPANGVDWSLFRFVTLWPRRVMVPSFDGRPMAASVRV